LARDPEIPQREYLLSGILPFLSDLKEYGKKYLIETGPDIANYEDLYSLCLEFENFGKEGSRNFALEPFVEVLRLATFERVWKFLPVDGEPASADVKKQNNWLSAIGSDACRAIIYVVWNELGKGREIKGFDAVADLARSANVSALDIVTLNHDCLVETLLSNEGIPCIDGFGELREDIRYFDKGFYSLDIKVNLLKLHGSISLFQVQERTPTGVVFKFAIRNGKVEWYEQDGYGRYNLTPIFLVGMDNKLRDYWIGIFRDLFSRFNHLLDLHDTIVVSGYGWKDTGINEILFDWMYRSEGNRLIILHEDKKTRAYSQIPPFSNKTWEWIEEGRIVEVDKWLCNVSGDEILDLLWSGKR
jgi:hypothetical protein